MRRYLAAVLVCSLAPNAWAYSGSTTEEAVRKAPQAPASRESDHAAVLRDVVKQLKAARYKDIEIVPQVFVARAKNQSGEEVTIFIDVETMRAVELGKPPAEASGTTGIDAAGDRPFRRK